MNTTMTTHDVDTLAINTIRALCMDAVQQANSGHPGTPMGMAPVAYTLWQRFWRFDPSDPIWPNRDRLVLSEGHASTLLSSLLHPSAVQAVDPDYEVLGSVAGRRTDGKYYAEFGLIPHSQTGADEVPDPRTSPADMLRPHLPDPRRVAPCRPFSMACSHRWCSS
jgi:hypothetical protein